jgi:monoamine oxidase
LIGFLNGSANYYSVQERKEKVIHQLYSYFGNEAECFISYNDKIWNDQYIQPNKDEFLPPHFNNGNINYDESYMKEKLFFASSETSNTFSGYMEGAVIASKSIVETILKKI